MDGAWQGGTRAMLESFPAARTPSPLTAGLFQNDLWLLAAALAIGLLIGVERGWKRREQEEGTRVAGVRTFALIGLLGGACALVAQRAQSPLFLGFCFLGVSAALVTAHVLRFQREGDLGLTSLSAGLLTFALGAMAAYGLVVPAVSAAVVATFLLSFKPKLHAWIAHLTSEELQAALKLLLVSVVLLPILPNRGYGPWGVLNPYEIWWMVVLIAAVSFVGYVLVKVAGTRRGLIFTAIAAGLVSSTALTLHFARLSRKRAATDSLLAAGILLACGTMFPRMLLLTWVVDPRVSFHLLWPVLAMAAVVYGAAGIRLWRGGGHRGTAQEVSQAYVQSPLDLWPAVHFGLLLSFIILAAEALRRWLGEAGVYLVSALSGITDVDAITLSLSRMAGAELGLSVVATGITLAAVANNLAKGGIAAVVSRGALAGAVLPPLLVASVVGALLALWG